MKDLKSGRSKTTLRLCACAFAASTLLAACGGGGGGGNVATLPPVTDTPPASPADFSISLSEQRLVLLQGASSTVKATLTRRAGFDGAVQVNLSNLPAGVTATAATIAAGSNEATLTVTALTSAAHSLPTTGQAQGSSGASTAKADLTVTVRGLPGAVDTSFTGAENKLGKQITPMGSTDAYATHLAVQADGKVITVGYATTQFGQDFSITRHSRDGTLDASFGNGGKLTTAIGSGVASDQAHAVLVQPDGKILVAGSTDAGGGAGLEFALVRYNTDGTLDSGFGSAGKLVLPMGGDVDVARSLLLQADGKIVVGGDSNVNAALSGVDFALARLLPNGQLDTSFGSNGRVITAIKSQTGRDSLHQLLVQTIAGETRLVAVGGEGDFIAARYQVNGQLDTSFGNSGKISGLFNANIGAARAAVALDGGRLVIAGHINHDVAIVRLNANGTLDSSFGNAGRVLTAVSTSNWDEATALVRQADGKLVVGGWVYEGNSSSGDFLTLRYNDNGQLDTSFAQAGMALVAMAPTGRNDAGRALVLQADERVPAVRVLQAGEANVGGTHGFALLRYWL
jgi:uncharacterized delta-60 repeat protein